MPPRATHGANALLTGASLAGLVLYFLPAIIGFARSKRNALALLLFNFFLGWTFVGWVIALVWSFMRDPLLA